MKLRHSFVSNSSPSSFIALLPKKFNVDEFIEKLSDEKILEACEDAAWEPEDGWEDDDTNLPEAKTYVKETLTTLIDDGYVYDMEEVYLCSALLEDYIIYTVDVSSDDGSFNLLRDEDVETVKRILGEDS